MVAATYRNAVSRGFTSLALETFSVRLAVQESARSAHPFLVLMDRRVASALDLHLVSPVMYPVPTTMHSKIAARARSLGSSDESERTQLVPRRLATRPTSLLPFYLHPCLV